MMNDNNNTTQRKETVEERIEKLESAVFGRDSSMPFAGTPKKQSIKEFLMEKKPSGKSNKTLAVGYYLEKFEGQQSFNVNDLEDAFRRAKEPVPLNINDKVNHNIRKGLVMEAAEKKDSYKAWVLTNKGEQLIESGFNGGKKK